MLDRTEPGLLATIQGATSGICDTQPTSAKRTGQETPPSKSCKDGHVTQEIFLDSKRLPISCKEGLKGLSRYLFERNRIRRPIEKIHHRLPPIYEDYLTYHEQSRQAPYKHIKQIAAVLAALIKSRRSYSQAKPPRFLRPREIQTLFAGLKLSTPKDLRAYAMVHLAYYLGLRPFEIVKIKLDDISFAKRELTLEERKGVGSNLLLRAPIKTGEK